jgi:bifunctional UDP-N-acetylglucosamine pyrophosphorylase/glucosamine-1-phosphate N-acetyltransferase
MQTQIIILAAGQGRRMNNDDMPKVLLPLGGKPVILHLLEELESLEAGKNPVIVVGYKSSAVEKALGKKYTYVLQRDQRGTAHAVGCAEKQITAKNVLVLYGDVPFIRASSLEQLMRLHEKEKAAMTMFTTRVPNFTGSNSAFLHFGRIIRDRFGNIAKITEYKDATDEEKQILEVNPGIYIFKSDWLWDHIGDIKPTNAQNEYYLTDIVEVAIQEEVSVCCCPSVVKKF